METVEKLIEQCDYFVLALSGCYGGLNADGKSFTEVEFEIAEKKHVPVLAFIPESPESFKASDVREPLKWAKLLSFRDRVQKRGKMNATYTDKGNLAVRVYHSLTNAIKEGKRTGWRRDVAVDSIVREPPANVALKLNRPENIFWAASDVMETIQRLLAGC